MEVKRALESLMGGREARWSVLWKVKEGITEGGKEGGVRWRECGKAWSARQRQVDELW
ncbi:hypothetical protein Pmani_025731, partial [Petrolisthes manimaculis]